jgi:hypothetical protein
MKTILTSCALAALLFVASSADSRAGHPATPSNSSYRGGHTSSSSSLRHPPTSLRPIHAPYSRTWAYQSRLNQQRSQLQRRYYYRYPSPRSSLHGRSRVPFSR